MTASDLITRSFKLLNVLAPGESLSADEANDALLVLNELLETWRLDRLMVYNESHSVFSLISNQQRYTIGGGGTFNVERPVWIESGRIIFNYGTGSQYELPLNMVTDQKWSEISLKQITSTFPTACWFNQSYPLAELYFWPIPTDPTIRVDFLLPQSISSPVTLATTLALPPGYSKALRYWLAVDLASEYGRAINPMILKIARETKAAIMDQNGSPLVMSCDPAILSREQQTAAYGGGLNVIMGGGTNGNTPIVIPMGGSRNSTVSALTSVWMPVVDWPNVAIDGTNIAARTFQVSAEIWSVGNTPVQMRLWNLTLSAVAGTSAIVTATTPTAAVFAATIAPSNCAYRLELLDCSVTPGNECYGIGTLESTS